MNDAGDSAAAEEPVRRRAITIRGLLAAFLIVGVLLSGFAVSYLLNAGGLDGAAGTGPELRAGGMVFERPGSWEPLAEADLARLESTYPGDDANVQAFCPPVRRGGVPFPCLAEPGYLYVTVVDEPEKGTLRQVGGDLLTKLEQARPGFRLHEDATRRTRDNSEYRYLEFSFDGDDRYGRYRSVVAAVDSGRRTVYIVAQGPDAAFRAVRPGISRFIASGTQASG